MPRGRAITAAIIRSAKMRAAFEHLARNLDVWQARVVVCFLGLRAQLVRSAAWALRLRIVQRRVPVGGPFPDIADHVEETVAVRRKGGDGRGPLVAIGCQILPREFALPGVGLVFAARCKVL